MRRLGSDGFAELALPPLRACSGRPVLRRLPLVRGGQELGPPQPRRILVWYWILRSSGASSGAVLEWSGSVSGTGPPPAHQPRIAPRTASSKPRRLTSQQSGGRREVPRTLACKGGTRAPPPAHRLLRCLGLYPPRAASPDVSVDSRATADSRQCVHCLLSCAGTR